MRLFQTILALSLPLVLALFPVPIPEQNSGPAKQPAETPGKLVFSHLTWEGEYFSKDFPGGVQITPTLGAIYTIQANGTGQKQIVAPGQRIDYPQFSPDGQWIYYQAKTSGHSQISRCKPDGSGVAKVSAMEKLGKQWRDAYGYALSRTGGKMVYTVHDGSTGRVVAANADGSEPRLVAPELGYLYMAALSPTGDRVVCSGPATGYRLVLVKLPDGKPLHLTPNHPESFVPRFTPDGQTIIFFRRDGDIYSVGTDGKNLRRLTTGNGHVEFKLSAKDQHGSSDAPDISPDGKQIAYIAVKNGVPNVYTMNVDGTKQKQITFRKTPCGRVRWSPDGKHLAFVSIDGPGLQLFTVPAAGGDPRALTQSKGAVYFLDWAPGSTGK